MTEFIINAHDLCKTRLCQAAGCENDAEHGWPLCARHDKLHRRGIKITLHEIPQNLGPTLPCCTCSNQKPDDAFHYHRGKKARRYRCSECKECCAARMAAWRVANRDANNAKQRAAKALRRAAKRTA